VCPRNHILDRGPDPPWKERILRGKKWPIVKYRKSVVSCGRTAEPTEMLIGLRTQMGPKNHALDGGPEPPWKGAILRGKRGSLLQSIVVVVVVVEMNII